MRYFEHNYLNKLLQNDPNYSRENNTLSLNFEYAGDGVVKINRFYYNSANYIRYSVSYLDNDNYPTVKVSSFYLETRAFIETMIRLAKRLEKKRLPQYRAIEEIVYGYGILNELNKEEKNEKEYSDMMEEMLSHLNDAIAGYQHVSGVGFDETDTFNGELIEIFEETEYIRPLPTDDNVLIPPCLPEEYEDTQESDLFELRVYNVGQANCSALIKYTDYGKTDYKVVVVFDYGVEGNNSNKSLKEMISKIDEKTTIIISHFDVDHINNIGLMSLNKTCRWLFPEHKPKSQKANILYHMLIRVAKKKSRDGEHAFCYKAPCSLSPYLRINQNTDGKKDKDFQSTIANAECIISTLQIANKGVLIPADALYKDFPSDVMNYQYQYVLIPHHGCRYIDKTHALVSEYENIIKITSNNPVGIVMCGKGGMKFGHANTFHLGWYKHVVAFVGSSFFLSKNNPDNSYKCALISDDYYSINF